MDSVLLLFVMVALIVLAVIYSTQRNKTAGTIYVDQKDLDLYLELEVPIEEIVSRKQVSLSINIVPSDSHE
jgi:hypothetical protein